MKNLRLSEIWIYPVKSLGGFQVLHSTVREKGLLYDRRFMLVDDGGTFMTQRTTPKMALFKTAMNGSTLTIRHQADALELSAVPTVKGNEKPVQVWDDLVMANEVDPAYSAWFSERLSKSCKLVFFPEENTRLIDPSYNIDKRNVGLADAYPLLIIGQASLDDLNTRLEEPLPINRFRPNLVFTGGEAYEEDNWNKFTVGSSLFAGVKPCARCVLTTVNQDTAEKGSEPLKTLARYRARNNKIYFGQNLIALNSGDIRVGDTITLQ